MMAATNHRLCLLVTLAGVTGGCSFDGSGLGILGDLPPAREAAELALTDGRVDRLADAAADAEAGPFPADAADAGDGTLDQLGDHPVEPDHPAPDLPGLDLDPACPSVCDHCFGDTCVITDCDNGCTCPDGMVCAVNCFGEACGGEIHCGGATSCAVVCQGEACGGHIHCESAANCTVNCGGESCAGEINCGVGACIVTCQGEACTGQISCGLACACDVFCFGQSCSGAVYCKAGPCFGGGAQLCTSAGGCNDC